MTPIIIHKRGGAPTQPRRWWSIRVNLYLYAALVLVLFLGTIQAAQLAGVWSTSGKVTASGDQVQITIAFAARAADRLHVSAPAHQPLEALSAFLTDVLI